MVLAAFLVLVAGALGAVVYAGRIFVLLDRRSLSMTAGAAVVLAGLGILYFEGGGSTLQTQEFIDQRADGDVQLAFARREPVDPLYPEEELDGAKRRLALFLIQFWGGEQTYADALAVFSHPLTKLVLVGLSFAFFYLGTNAAERDRLVSDPALMPTALTRPSKGAVITAPSRLAWARTSINAPVLRQPLRVSRRFCSSSSWWLW